MFRPAKEVIYVAQTHVNSTKEETARVVRAVFPRSNVLMQLHDTLEAIY